MFGNKKQSTPLGSKEDKKDPLMVSTIPEAFYGGKDPDIYKAKAPVASLSPSMPLTSAPKPPAPPNNTPTQRPAGGGKKKRVVIIVGVLLLILISIGLVLWLTFGRSTEVAQEPEPVTPRPQPTQPERPVQPTTTEPVVVEPPVPTSTVPTPTQPTPLDRITFPRVLLVDSADVDGDGITDLEEEYYNTDSGTWDTDGDGFYDGQEIENLYSPTDAPPTLLVDGGAVAEYINPTYQYRLYYPIEWNVAAVDASADQVLMTAATGDYIQIIRSPKEGREPFGSWFGRVAQEQRIGELVSFENRFDVKGFYRNDKLVAYFDTPSAVYVMIYNPGVADSIPFRQTMIMMYQGFRPSQSLAVIPEQPVLPPNPTPSDVRVESTATATTTNEGEDTETQGASLLTQ